MAVVPGVYDCLQLDSRIKANSSNIAKMEQSVSENRQQITRSTALVDQAKKAAVDEIDGKYRELLLSLEEIGLSNLALVNNRGFVPDRWICCLLLNKDDTVIEASRRFRYVSKVNRNGLLMRTKLQQGDVLLFTEDSENIRTLPSEREGVIVGQILYGDMVYVTRTAATPRTSRGICGVWGRARLPTLLEVARSKEKHRWLPASSSEEQKGLSQRGHGYEEQRRVPLRRRSEIGISAVNTTLKERGR